MPIEHVPDSDLSYYLIAFDSDGKERADDRSGRMSALILQALTTESISDVFVMSHGWKGDVPAAREQYTAWIRAMVACESDIARIKQARPNFRALIVGFHWPSQPWGDEEFGGRASFATAGSGNGVSSLEQLVDRYAERIANTPQARAALTTLFQSAAENIAPQTLPENVRQAYLTLNKEAGLEAAGEGTAPGQDREAFDPDEAYRHARAMERQASFGGDSNLGGLLSPLRQLSFWKMKDRARRLGETAGFTLLCAMQNAAPADRDVRFHLMGHSFGCIVVSAMLQGDSRLPRPIDSLTLVQGALSLWSYCENIPKVGRRGYFRRIIDDALVRGPIITTQSNFDTAVGRFYPLGAGVAQQVVFDARSAGARAPQVLPKYGGLGAFGIQGPGLEIVSLEMQAADATYPFEPRKIYNLESSRFICHGSGASGAHSDIAQPEVAHAMWSAVCAQA